jgi:RNA polymerase sigma-70 factor (ECF subfamily)
VAQPSSSLSPDLGERYREYFPRVFAYIYGRVRNAHATEDLTSETFRRVFAEAPPTGRQAYPLLNEETFAVRLFATARRLLVSHLRAQSGAGASQPQDDVEDAVLKRADLARILGHLGRFPQQEQDIVALKFDAELTNAQIARVVGLSEGKVGVALYRALRKLHKALERGD